MPLLVWLCVEVTGRMVDCDVDPASTEPQGVHLAYAGDASSSMAVSFFTCGKGDTPFLQLLGGKSEVAQTVHGSSSSYYDRAQHLVMVAGLTPGTTYSYVVGLEHGSKSSTFAFSTSARGASQFSAAVIGDMGVNNSAATIAALTKRTRDINFTIHVGDVAYADDCNVPLHIERSAGRGYEAVYDLYQNSIEPFAAAAPYMVMPGNHDVSCHILSDIGCPKELRNFSALNHRFRMPSVESGASTLSHHNMWYSWRVGNVHFVSLSTETDFPGSPTTPHTFVGGGAGGGFGDQLGWLRADLTAARADPLVSWIVAMGHRPWYGTSKMDWPVRAQKKVQASFEPLLREFGVDIWLCGHKHYYERMVGAYRGEANDDGPVMIINGAAGSNEGIDSSSGVGGLVAAVGYKEPGYGELSQVNETALRWRFFFSASGSMVDEFVLHPKRRFERVFV